MVPFCTAVIIAKCLLLLLGWGRVFIAGGNIMFFLSFAVVLALYYTLPSNLSHWVTTVNSPPTKHLELPIMKTCLLIFGCDTVSHSLPRNITK